jgi:6-carboxyhexanoate--CoA ligase
MMQKNLYSIRMRATAGGRHISGAERIVPQEKIDGTVQELIARAQGKAIPPGQIEVHIDCLGDETPRLLTALDVVTVNAPDMFTGCSAAACVLELAGVTAQAAETGIRCLRQGAAPSGGNMRGAIIMDSQTGERLEPDPERGVRVSRFDWVGDALSKIKRKLESVGLTHYRTHEALALATKVAYGPGLVAELCWSDEPGYIAGYVSSRTVGYVRFPMLKQKGDPCGGRVFYVNTDKLDMDTLIRYLQTETVLISDVGLCRRAVKPEAYLKNRCNK